MSLLMAQEMPASLNISAGVTAASGYFKNHLASSRAL